MTHRFQLLRMNYYGWLEMKIEILGEGSFGTVLFINPIHKLRMRFNFLDDAGIKVSY